MDANCTTPASNDPNWTTSMWGLSIGLGVSLLVNILLTAMMVCRCVRSWPKKEMDDSQVGETAVDSWARSGLGKKPGTTAEADKSSKVASHLDNAERPVSSQYEDVTPQGNEYLTLPGEDSQQLPTASHQLQTYEAIELKNGVDQGNAYMSLTQTDQDKGAPSQTTPRPTLTIPTKNGTDGGNISQGLHSGKVEHILPLVAPRSPASLTNDQRPVSPRSMVNLSAFGNDAPPQVPSRPHVDNLKSNSMSTLSTRQAEASSSPPEEYAYVTNLDAFKNSPVANSPRNQGFQFNVVTVPGAPMSAMEGNAYASLSEMSPSGEYSALSPAVSVTRPAGARLDDGLESELADEGMDQVTSQLSSHPSPRLVMRNDTITGKPYSYAPPEATAERFKNE
eukprot:scpid59298/ scgid12966/ 